MEKSEVIKILQEAAVKVMKEKKVVASILIAEAIRILYADDMITCYEDLIIGNNPMAIEADSKFKDEKIYNERKKVMYRTYDTLEEGIANYISIHEKDKFDKIKEVYNYKDALYKLSAQFYNVNELEKFIMAYRLDSLDQDALKQMYSGRKNIIDPVKSNKNAELLKQLASTHTGVGLNKTIAEVLKEEEEKKEKKIKLPENITTRSLTKGSKIKLTNANIYKDLTTNIPARSITGTYYLYDGKYKYHRYAIVFRQEFVGNPEMILGYIDETSIKK